MGSIIEVKQSVANTRYYMYYITKEIQATGMVHGLCISQQMGISQFSIAKWLLNAPRGNSVGTQYFYNTFSPIFSIHVVS